MNIIVTALLAALIMPALADDSKPAASYQEVTSRTIALLCADQSDNRIRLINPTAAGDRKPALWSYPAEGEKPLKYKPTDAKRVGMQGVVYVLASYHGRVQLVRFKDRKLIKD